MNVLTRVVSISAIAAAALVATGCGKLCKKADETRTNVIALDGELNRGIHAVTDWRFECAAFGQRASRLPTDAEFIREIANSEFSEEVTTCLEYRYIEDPWSCYGYAPTRPGEPGRPIPRPCTVRPVCVRWQVDVIREPGYKEAIELAAGVDTLYAQLSELCTMARGGKSLIEINLAALNAQLYIEQELLPRADVMMANAGCTASAAK